jgi:hypothetical protein
VQARATQMFNDSKLNGQFPRMSRAGEAAIEADKAWFRDHPDKTTLRRKVKPKELPRALRNQGIREVVIERAGPALFVRRFLDIDGRPPPLLRSRLLR